MQVPRYRTAYTTIRFAPVMVDMNLPLRETLAPGPLFPRLSGLVTSLSLRLFLSLFLSRSYSARVSSKFLSVHLSVRPPPATLISTPQICDAPREKSKSPLAVARTGLQNELGAIKKMLDDPRMGLHVHRFIKHLATD